MEAVTNRGDALRYAAEELRCDYDIVMRAVSKDGSALTFAAEQLRGSREIVMKAVSENGSALSLVALNRRFWIENRAIRNRAIRIMRFQGRFKHR